MTELYILIEHHGGDYINNQIVKISKNSELAKSLLDEAVSKNDYFNNNVVTDLKTISARPDATVQGIAYEEYTTQHFTTKELLSDKVFLLVCENSGELKVCGASKDKDTIKQQFYDEVERSGLLDSDETTIFEDSMILQNEAACIIYYVKEFEIEL